MATSSNSGSSGSSSARRHRRKRHRQRAARRQRSQPRVLEETEHSGPPKRLPLQELRKPPTGDRRAPPLPSKQQPDPRDPYRRDLPARHKGRMWLPSGVSGCPSSRLHSSSRRGLDVLVLRRHEDDVGRRRTPAAPRCLARAALGEGFHLGQLLECNVVDALLLRADLGIGRLTLAVEHRPQIRRVWLTQNVEEPNEIACSERPFAVAPPRKRGTSTPTGSWIAGSGAGGCDSSGAVVPMQTGVRDVADHARDEHPVVGLERPERYLDWELGAAFAPSVELESCTERARLRLGRVTGAVSEMTLTAALGHQHLESLAEQLVAAIAKTASPCAC